MHKFFQTPMYCKPNNLTGYSNRFFQFRFAQEKFNENQCKLLERLQCVQLQFEHMEKLAITELQEQNKQVKQAKKQFQGIVTFSKQLRAKVTQDLLKKQTMIEEQAQRRDFTKQYEQRIAELDAVKYSKEVDISADHVGKLSSEKPTEQKVNKLSRFKNQFNATISYLERISSIRKKIKHLQIKHLQQKFSHGNRPSEHAVKIKTTLTENQNNDPKDLYKTQSAITKQSSSSQQSSESNPEIDHKKSKKTKKMLLLNSQSKIYDKYNIEFDPQMTKMGQLLKIERIRQSKLHQQYDKLRQRISELCTENKNLSDEYRRMLRKDQPKLEPQCSVISDSSMLMVVDA